MTTVWCGENETSIGQLIVLTNDSVIVDSPKDDELAGIKQRLLAGESTAAVLSTDAHAIPLLSVVKISTNKNDEDIEVDFKEGSDTKTQTLWLANQEKRDEAFAKLKSIFGERFQETEIAYNIPRAAFGSLLALTIFGALTWAGAKAAVVFREAGDYDVEGRNSGLKALIAWILELLGPTGVYIIGGIFCLLSALVLFSRIKDPPVMQVLQEGAFKPGTTIGLIFKYALMFGVWFLAFRIYQFSIY